MLDKGRGYMGKTRVKEGIFRMEKTQHAFVVTDNKQIGMKWREGRE